MKKISHFSAMRIWTDLNADSKIFQGGSLTIGNFDGLHLGHQALFQALKRAPGPRVVVTFEPHPVQVLFPERGLKRLFPVADLAEQLPAYGIDLLVRMPFDKKFAAQPAQDFLQAVAKDALRIQVLVVGYDFALGRNREGDLSTLVAWGKGAGVRIESVGPVNVEGEPVSSRRLRELIEGGKVSAAERLLGRPFYLRGPVVRGAGRGRQLGIPTMNLQVENETWPAAGVYATWTRVDGRRLPSVTNVGTAPTFTDGSKINVETHVLGETIDAYGRTVDVEFMERIRAERRFSSPEDLKNQIDRDILEARRVLAK